MKLSQLFAIGVPQYTARDGGNPHSANLFVERATGILRDYGEGFAVFVGGRLAWFSNDVGGARNQAKIAVSYGTKREDIKIKRVVV